MIHQFDETWCVHSYSHMLILHADLGTTSNNGRDFMFNYVARV